MFGYVYRLWMLRSFRVAGISRHGTRSLALRGVKRDNSPDLDDIMGKAVSKPPEKTRATPELDKLMSKVATQLQKGSGKPLPSAVTDSIQPPAEETPIVDTISRGQGPPAANLNIIQKKKSPMDYIVLDSHRLYVKSTRNNTIVTLTNPNGRIIFRRSGAQAGYKGANRASYECGYACATSVLEKVAQLFEQQSIQLHVFLNGFGQGREAIFRALVASDHDRIKSCVTALTDTTPLKIGGTRPKKARRL